MPTQNHPEKNIEAPVKSELNLENSEEEQKKQNNQQQEEEKRRRKELSDKLLKYNRHRLNVIAKDYIPFKRITTGLDSSHYLASEQQQAEKAKQEASGLIALATQAPAIDPKYSDGTYAAQIGDYQYMMIVSKNGSTMTLTPTPGTQGESNQQIAKAYTALLQAHAENGNYKVHLDFPNLQMPMNNMGRACKIMERVEAMLKQAKDYGITVTLSGKAQELLAYIGSNQPVGHTDSDWFNQRRKLHESIIHNLKTLELQQAEIMSGGRKAATLAGQLDTMQGKVNQLGEQEKGIQGLLPKLSAGGDGDALNHDDEEKLQKTFQAVSEELKNIDRTLEVEAMTRDLKQLSQGNEPAVVDSLKDRYIEIIDNMNRAVQNLNNAFSSFSLPQGNSIASSLKDSHVGVTKEIEQALNKIPEMKNTVNASLNALKNNVRPNPLASPRPRG